MKYQNYIARLFVLVFALSLIACDNNGGDSPQSDDSSELFFGNWTLTGADDDTGSRLGDLANRYNSIQINFDTDNTFSMELDSNNENFPDATLVGTFEATESTSLMRLTTDFNGQSVSLTFSFSFEDDTNKVVRFSTTLTQTNIMNLAIGTDFSGPTTLTFSAIED